MTVATTSIEDLTLKVTHDVQINASLEATFAAVLEQIGPSNSGPDGTPLPMIIEPWPGGRWFRDLGEKNGHNWGHVQAIKRPTLLEISGPLFMSYAVASNLQYRLKEVDGGTLLSFSHSVLGLVPDDHRKGLSAGWTPLLDRIRRSAEAA